MAGIEYNRPERDARTRAQTGGGGRPGPVDRPDRPRTEPRAESRAGATAAQLECPSCHRSDEVRAVPAICVSGHTRYREDADGDRSAGALEVVPRLAEALAVAPPPPVTAGRTALGVLLVLVSIGTFIGGAQGGHWFADAPAAEVNHGSMTLWGGATGAPAPEPGAELLFLAWISGFALLGAVLLIVSAVRTQRAFRARTAAGRDAAEEVWSRGWCCARCAVVHFGTGPAMTLQEFRREVWGAGGYGDLAEVHRATGTTADPATDPPRAGR
ncbi:hypothetical protein AB0B78_09230 [Streptomyces sp. NPDC040724]|uniref:hypothetical protein n=1 Tax=unclassified Streptomyces TaxID=2593676 RepID=UPI0033D1F50D